LIQLYEKTEFPEIGKVFCDMTVSLDKQFQRFWRHYDPLKEGTTKRAALNHIPEDLRPKQ